MQNSSDNNHVVIKKEDWTQ